MTNVAQRAFNAGELSPAHYARTDLARYQAGLRTCRNFIALRDGGITNRPGLGLVGACSLGAAVRLIPFIYNEDAGYCLEFAAGVIRVVQNGAYTGVSIASPYPASVLFALRYSQTAAVMTLTHPSYPVHELTRVDATTWTLAAAVFGPALAAPTGLATSGGAALGFINWVVTALTARGEESVASSPVGITATLLFPKSMSPRTLTWTPVTGASSYNIYKAFLSTGAGVGAYGYIGTANTPSFYDDGISPDDAHQPPTALTDFSTAPTAVGGCQQRQFFASAETFWASRTGSPRNFDESSPLRDDDAIEATLIASRVNAIRHIVDADGLYLLTAGGEWKVQGDGNGIIRPTDINALNFSKHGSAILPPIVIDRRILFTQARQAIVRQVLTNEVGPGYVGANLTLASSHLFKGYTLVDWAYAEEPHSVIWCVRSDGTLLGLTTLEENGQPTVLAWHRHDTDGTVESVCVVPEESEDRVYLVVRRNGTRLLERMESRYVTDVMRGIFMDSAVSYDGTNTGSESMTLSGSSSWAYDELVTVTRSVGGFSINDVGNRVDMVAADGLPLQVTLTSYSSGTIMQGFPNRTVPADLRSVAMTLWTLATRTVTGLSHLEGKAVSVLGDGYVVASPNNEAVSASVVVSGGVATLPRPYGIVHVGLPYLSDAETLDIDSSSGPSLKATKMLIRSVTAYVEESRTFFAGQSFPTGTDATDNMEEAVVRNVADDYDLTMAVTDTIDVTIPSSWNSNGRVAIRHVDPSPLTILALIPRGEIG